MAKATDESIRHDRDSTSPRDRALCLASEATREPDYHRRRELEQDASRAWRAVRGARS